MHGVEFNDVALALACDGAPAGSPVLLDPHATGQPGTLDVATLIRALRQAMPEPSATALWAAVPALVGTPQLGEALRQLRRAGFIVQGFVDSAAVLASWLQISGPAIVVELTRHAVAISVVGHEADDITLQRSVVLPGGAAALHTEWLQLAARTLVQQTRFDPLHSQRDETALRDTLPGLARQAQHAGEVSSHIDTGAQAFTLALTRDQLAEAAADWWRPIVAALQALTASLGECTLLLPRAFSDIPGIDAACAACHATNIFCFADDAMARAASGMPTAAGDGGAVQYLTRVPRLQWTASVAELQTLHVRSADAVSAATHLVFRGRAIAIPETGLVLGRDPGTNGAVTLPEGIAGLSRRHCTLRREGRRTTLVDHSSHGSFVDGYRVRGRALLAAGSTLRLGEPGIELPLIAIERAEPAAG